MKKLPLPLGTRIAFKRGDLLNRTYDFEEMSATSSRKFWQRNREHYRADVYASHNEELIEGIIIGFTKLSNGVATYESNATYKATNYFEAYTIAFKLDEKPRHILPTDVTVISASAPQEAKAALELIQTDLEMYWQEYGASRGVEAAMAVLELHLGVNHGAFLEREEPTL